MITRAAAAHHDWRTPPGCGVREDMSVKVVGFVLLGAGVAVLIAVLARIAWRATPSRGRRPVPAPPPLPYTDVDHVTAEGASYVRCADLDSFLRQALNGVNVALFMPYAAHEEEYWEPGGTETVFSRLRSAIRERNSRYVDPLGDRAARFCSACWLRDRKTLHTLRTYANGDFCGWCEGQGVLYLYRGEDDPMAPQHS